MTKIIACILIFIIVGTGNLFASHPNNLFRCKSNDLEPEFLVQNLDNIHYIGRFRRLIPCKDLGSFDKTAIFLVCENEIDTYFLTIKKDYSSAKLDNDKYECERVN